jgi:hypothetical protein
VQCGPESSYSVGHPPKIIKSANQPQGSGEVRGGPFSAMAGAQLLYGWALPNVSPLHRL